MRYFIGRHHTEETKQKMSDVHKGYRHSEEAKKKIGEKIRKKWQEKEYRNKIIPILKNNGRFIRTPEIREKMSKARIGQHRSKETKLKMSLTRKGKFGKWNIGKKRSEETRRRMSLAAIGHSAWNKGKHPSIEIRRKLSAVHKGEKSHFWKGGITTLNYLIRCSIEYRLWREAVFSRDNWTCQNPKCGKSGCKIHAHHIKPFSQFPELRFTINNGVTLCKECHKNITCRKNEERVFSY